MLDNSDTNCACRLASQLTIRLYRVVLLLYHLYRLLGKLYYLTKCPANLPRFLGLCSQSNSTHLTRLPLEPLFGRSARLSKPPHSTVRAYSFVV